MNQVQHSWLRFGVILLVLTPVVGCSSPPSGTVTGQVSLNGEALDDAVILFRPVGGGQAGGGQASIQGGSYKIDLIPVGDYSVWVMADRKTGRKIPILDVKAGAKREYDEEVVQIIPIRYNARTELKVAVEAGENQRDFNLTKKGRR